MTLTPEKRTADFQTMVNGLPSDFSVVPTEKLITNGFCRLSTNEILHLTYLLNLSGDQKTVAAILGVSLDTAKATFHDALAKIGTLDKVCDLQTDRLHIYPDRKEKLLTALVDGGYFTHREVAKQE